jgi:hypothetical protein
LTHPLKEEPLAELKERNTASFDDAEVDRLDATRLWVRVRERRTREMTLVDGKRHDVSERQYQVLRHRVERWERIEEDLVCCANRQRRTYRRGMGLRTGLDEHA